ncbi:type IV secretory system conjugative DNA transfer family protein [Conexibacter stalactiti]|uniref:Type IV secretory system conjugative DNA transfer family protein n=1 Tax=Conexibacter stalactiti TaxID=1940611 RepID=A0ABU4HW57_9ACTN|nr:type IV secretory system conjugative DNA transfer family protein [Conexibacter stalactiti]MDW5597557.1 type IV secretory system conjugative DNA transfer family protein [Conexibacter stalactiti]MEC5038199.1 type IV secretory system conjugative DNA transfer family protein [Conexibacter stalactiti]
MSSNMILSGGGRQDADYKRLAVAVAAIGLLIAIAAAFAWGIPMVAGWVHAGTLPRLGLIDAARALTDGELLGPAPGRAYPRPVGALLPDAREFRLIAVLTVIGLLASVFAVGREIEIRMSRQAADRRWWQLRGRRPQEFGRYRTVREMIVTGRSPDHLIVGHIARPRAAVAVSRLAQLAVVAAPRTGKSSGLVIPAILEHEGPIVTTSVRADILDHTLARRRALGRVWVWDPFGADTDSWDLLHGCERWEHALLVARWLGHAQTLGQGGNQEYFDQEAENLMAPYLHAAALTPDVTAAGVYRWILGRELDQPLSILRDAGAVDACERLKSVYAYTDRQRDGILGTAAIYLKAYGHPAAERTARRSGGVTPEELADGPNALYIVAGREHQQLLAPLVVTMLSSLLHWLSERENRTGEALAPSALFALDETASIAPIQDLPQILATCLGSGVRFMTVWHSISQIHRTFGEEAAAEILALSQAKVFMGSITDPLTRREIVDLLGHDQRSRRSGRLPYAVDVMTSQALQRMTAGEGLLVNGQLAPVIFRQRRHYLDPDLRRLKSASAS